MQNTCAVAPGLRPRSAITNLLSSVIEVLKFRVKYINAVKTCTNRIITIPQMKRVW